MIIDFFLVKKFIIGKMLAGLVPNKGGFNFDLSVRLKADDSIDSSSKTTKTGTTISGMIYSEGVILGADTRSTNGETVADKNCEKIHYIAPNIYCCGAGTAADTEAVTGTFFS